MYTPLYLACQWYSSESRTTTYTPVSRLGAGRLRRVPGRLLRGRGCCRCCSRLRATSASNSACSASSRRATAATSGERGALASAWRAPESHQRADRNENSPRGTCADGQREYPGRPATRRFGNRHIMGAAAARISWKRGAHTRRSAGQSRPLFLPRLLLFFFAFIQKNQFLPRGASKPAAPASGPHEPQLIRREGVAQ